MKKYKTNPKYRNTYRYYFVDGKSQEIVVSDEVTAEDISFLHQLDDEEVDRERRENYRVPIHYEEYDFDDENDDLPTNPFLIDTKTPWDEMNREKVLIRETLILQRLHIAISELTPLQQELIQRIFYEGKSQADIAREDNVSRMAITNRMKKIIAQLRSKMI